MPQSRRRSVKTLAVDEPAKRQPDGKPFGPRPGGIRMTEVVNRLERLPLTPENLTHLTAPWAQR